MKLCRRAAGYADTARSLIGAAFSWFISLNGSKPRCSLRRVLSLSLGFQAGAVVLFIHWRVAAERRGDPALFFFTWSAPALSSFWSADGAGRARGSASPRPACNGVVMVFFMFDRIEPRAPRSDCAGRADRAAGAARRQQAAELPGRLQRQRSTNPAWTMTTWHTFLPTSMPIAAIAFRVVTAIACSKSGRPWSTYRRQAGARLEHPIRWGNRPASLWIAEDFGCCASG